MEQVLSRENLLTALKRVECNKGSHGIDGMSAKDIRRHFHENRKTLRKALREETCPPSPVRRIEILKANGWSKAARNPYRDRPFHPTSDCPSIDPIHDPTFSENSYGFCQNKRGHDAVRKAKGYIKEGYR
jgi:RNA-directed DNA polymerase